MYLFGIDIIYLIFALPAILLSFWAQQKVKSTFEKYNKAKTFGGLTGAQVARHILDQNDLEHISIEHIPGELSDHFDPTEEVIRLSDSTYGSNSIGAVGVAAHEAGHAVQHATGYVPIKLRNALVPATTFGNAVSIPLIMLGFFLGYGQLVYIGIFLFAFVAVFQLVTLPVEFNASKRAIEILESDNILYDEELVGAKKVLSAAALTYVAALLTTLATLFRYILLARTRSR